MPSKKTIATLALFAVLLLCLCGGLYYQNAQTEMPPGRPDYARSTLTITRADGKAFPFAVEVASTPQEQAYGLMFIHSLDDDKGMIFPYDPPQETAFWMENTLIPLDMLFVRPDGRIGRIVVNARPQDLTPIPSQGPVIAVIEIKGGQARKDGLAEGDKIDSPALPKTR